MFHGVSRLVLAATIVVCPLLCWSRAPGCSAQAVAKSCCCGDCGRNASAPANSCDPRPEPGDEPAKSCQCVCGGAIVEEQSAATDASAPSQDLLTPTVLSASAALEPLPRWLAHPPLSDGGENLGRSLRCLHQSLLC